MIFPHAISFARRTKWARRYIILMKALTADTLIWSTRGGTRLTTRGRPPAGKGPRARTFGQAGILRSRRQAGDGQAKARRPGPKSGSAPTPLSSNSCPSPFRTSSYRARHTDTLVFRHAHKTGRSSLGAGYEHGALQQTCGRTASLVAHTATTPTTLAPTSCRAQAKRCRKNTSRRHKRGSSARRVSDGCFWDRSLFVFR